MTELLRPLSVCIINPRFEPSFWGYDYALPLMPGDKRCWTVTGALPALAALAPAHCRVELLDENVERIDYADLACFDVVAVTGMIVQADRMREILASLKPLPPLVVVGGPYVSVADTQFEDLCDVRFVGEAEQTWPVFLTSLAAGRPIASRYEQAEKTDMTQVPAPRYDLLKSARYQMASLQFSRGCPFTCEFCDIITIFGRRPRLKTVEQMLVEIDVVREAGFRLCFIVDDNLIGNKREAKKLLAALAEWQKLNDYPLVLFAEASIDLADDPELLALMAQANVRQVFIGIESPRRAALLETKKLQNLRGDDLLSKVRRIRDAGLVVQAGFIVGFDSDDLEIFEDQFQFIQEAAVANAIVAILTPIPTTPLYARLAAADRLDLTDAQVPFRPLGLTQQELKDGYAALVERLYEPEAYLDRVFNGYAGSPAFRRQRRAADLRGGRPRTLGSELAGLLGALMQVGRLWSALSASKTRRRLGGVYLQRWFKQNLPLGRERMPLGAYVGLCISHWHHFRIANRSAKNAFGNVHAVTAPVMARAPAPVPARNLAA